MRPDAALASCTPRAGASVVTSRVTNVGDLAVLVTAPPNDPRLFVVERNGSIEIVEDGVRLDTPFIDISDNNQGPVLAGGERGLLGLAFHPDYAANGRFFVFYTTADLNVVAEYRVSADRNVADPDSEVRLLEIPDFASNHNGGMIEFGPDGYLYIGTGDGGSGGDPEDNGQDTFSLLAKMLRIDVDHAGGGRAYGIPPQNPFVAGGGAPEVLMYGLRNPWRWSFDRETFDLYIGDVGQGRVEEVNVIPFAELAGTDLGWDKCEGHHDLEDSTTCADPPAPRRAPTYEQVRPPWGTSNWEAVIGGAVYRSVCFPDLVGRYFFTDHTAGGLWSFVYANGAATDVIEHPGAFPSGPTSIYMDAYGELYLAGGNGDILHLVVE